MNREIQKVPGKIGEASPAGYSHRKAAQRSSKEYVELLQLKPRLISSHGVEPRELSDIAC